MNAEERVTLRDIYDVVNRLEDKFDGRLKAVEQDVEDIKTCQNRAIGIASVLASFVSLIATFIWNKLTNQA